jgi:hypothetical protein
VSVSGDTALVGAIHDDGAGSSSGSAYVLVLGSVTNGSACAIDAECTSGFCRDGVCCDSACGGGDPNDCQACSVAAGSSAVGTCAPIASGSACSDGTSQNGSCGPEGSGGAGGTGGGGEGGSAGSAPPEAEGGCSCSVVGSEENDSAAGWLALLGLGLVVARRSDQVPRGAPGGSPVIVSPRHRVSNRGVRWLRWLGVAMAVKRSDGTRSHEDFSNHVRKTLLVATAAVAAISCVNGCSDSQEPQVAEAESCGTTCDVLCYPNNYTFFPGLSEQPFGACDEVANPSNADINELRRQACSDLNMTLQQPGMTNDEAEAAWDDFRATIEDNLRCAER